MANNDGYRLWPFKAGSNTGNIFMTDTASPSPSISSDTLDILHELSQSNPSPNTSSFHNLTSYAAPHQPQHQTTISNPPWSAHSQIPINGGPISSRPNRTWSFPARSSDGEEEEAEDTITLQPNNSLIENQPRRPFTFAEDSPPSSSPSTLEPRLHTPPQSGSSSRGSGQSNWFNSFTSLPTFTNSIGNQPTNENTNHIELPRPQSSLNMPSRPFSYNRPLSSASAAVEIDLTGTPSLVTNTPRRGIKRSAPSGSQTPDRTSSSAKRRRLSFNTMKEKRRLSVSSDDEAIESIDLSNLEDGDDITEILRKKQAADLIRAQQEEGSAPRKLNALTCSICLSAPTNLTTTHCGHLFCWDCLDLALRAGAGTTQSRCPVCRTQVKRESDPAKHKGIDKSGFQALELKILVRGAKIKGGTES